jgi:hypothetical protein
MLLQRPGATRDDCGAEKGRGVVYRYRCVHPQAGKCPEEAERIVIGERRDARGEEVGREGVQEIEIVEEERKEEIEDAKAKLRRCVGTVERGTVSP